MRAGLQPVFHLTFSKAPSAHHQRFLEKGARLASHPQMLEPEDPQPRLTAIPCGRLASAVACGHHCLATADRQLWQRPHGQRGSGGPHAPLGLPTPEAAPLGAAPAPAGRCQGARSSPRFKGNDMGPHCHVPVVPAAWQQAAEGGAAEGEARPLGGSLRQFCFSLVTSIKPPASSLNGP